MISALHAQQNEDILGKIIDKKTKLPVVFATVQLQNAKQGVVADEDGQFRLPIRHKINKDTLYISSIGYASLTAPITSLKEKQINIFELIPKVEALDGVTIVAQKGGVKRRYTVDQIVSKAIQNIKLNYPTTPFSYIGYYRDYQELDNTYVNLNEGLIEVFDAGFKTNQLTNKYNQTALYEYQNNSDFKQDSVLAIAYDNKRKKYIKDGKLSPLGGNELSILNLHDPIRNYDKNSFSFVYILENQFLANHEFRLVQTSYLGDLPIYEISFYALNQATGVGNSAKGTLHIARDNFAIHKLAYNAYSKGTVEPIYSVNVEYTPKGDHLFLNYISFNNLFQVRNREDFKIEDVTLDQQENAFFLTFNSPVNPQSISNVKNFRFIYDRQKLSILDAELSAPKVVKVNLVNGTLPDIESLTESAMEKVTYKVRNVVDIGNRKLGKKYVVKANQFREIFVQEVFPNNPCSSSVAFVRKDAPLSKSTVNSFKERARYWINTPLKTTKN